MFASRIFIALLVILAPCVPRACADTFFVGPSGIDESTGARGTTEAQPFATLQYGIDRMKPGDTLIVLDGTYDITAPILIRDKPSTVQRPLHIRAQNPGAAFLSTFWRPAFDGETSLWSETSTAGMYVAHTRGAKLRKTKGAYVEGEEVVYLPRYASEADLNAPHVTVEKKHGFPGGDVYKPAQGLVIDSEQVYLRLRPGDGDPQGKLVWITRDLGGPMIRVVNTPGVILDGFRLGGRVEFDDASTYALVRNCVSEYGEGVILGSYGILEWCDFSTPGFQRFEQAVQSLAENKGNKAFHNGTAYTANPFWGLVKVYGIGGAADASTNTVFAGGKHVEFMYNRVKEGWDALRPGTYDYADTHHNVLIQLYDNAIEFDSFVKGQHGIENRLYNNFIESWGYGLISHQDQYSPNHGPQYVYRNVLIAKQSPDWFGWTIIKSDDDQNRHFYYHNLIWADVKSFISKAYKPDMRWRNNVVVRNGFLGGFDLAGTGTGQLIDFDHNFIVTDNNTAGRIDTRNYLGPNGARLGADSAIDELALVNPGTYLTTGHASRDFSQTSSSPLTDRGVVVPGFNDDFTGSAPDAGPFEGAMPGGPGGWPRSHNRVFSETTAKWLRGLPTLTVSRSGRDLALTLDRAAASTIEARYHLGGTAVNGSDYAALTGKAAIPAGRTSVNVRLEPLSSATDRTIVAYAAPSESYITGNPTLITTTIGELAAVSSSISIPPDAHASVDGYGTTDQ